MLLQRTAAVVTSVGVCNCNMQTCNTDPEGEKEVQTRDESAKVVSKIGRKTFVIEKGLKVYFLTDCMGRRVGDHIGNVTAFVHPGAHLSRSLVQHAHQLDQVSGPALIVIHIGTNDIASGATPQMFVDKMLALMDRIQRAHLETIYFCVSAVLPRPVDDVHTRSLVKHCNWLLERRCEHLDNVVFLRTNRAFLSRGKIIESFYKKDGLHLNPAGKHALFSFIKRFLWHFCRHKNPHKDT